MQIHASVELGLCQWLLDFKYIICNKLDSLGLSPVLNVSEIVGHEVKASVGAVSKVLDDYVEEHEEEEPDLFYSFHEFTVLES